MKAAMGPYVMLKCPGGLQLSVIQAADSADCFLSPAFRLHTQHPADISTVEQLTL